MHKWLFALALPLCALEVKPWIGTPFEFLLKGDYSYGYYPSIADANAPYNSHNQEIALALVAPIWPGIELELEMPFVNTRKRSWCTQSAALQARYQLMDDIQGAPISLTTGASFRYVLPANLSDPSCPYAERWNIELNASAGKEWATGPYWSWRTFLWAAIGQGSGGSPWARALLSGAKNWNDTWRAELFTSGYFGFGHERTVNVDAFTGYGKIAHRSCDVGAKATYRMQVWGKIDLEGTYRLWAASFPEKYFTVLFRYTFPFSWI